VDRDGQVERLEERPMQVQERALDTLGMVIVGNPVFMESIGDLQQAINWIRNNEMTDPVEAGRHLMALAIDNGGDENDMSVVVANVGREATSPGADVEPAAETFEPQE